MTVAIEQCQECGEELAAAMITDGGICVACAGRCARNSDGRKDEVRPDHGR